MTTNPIFLEDTFTVIDIDPNGKKYRKVSRIVAQAENSELLMSCDINVEVFPVTVRERLTIAMANTLDVEGRVEALSYDPTIYHRTTVLSAYDYAMHGRVFDCNTDDKSLQRVYCIVSFGGLLMKAEGTAETLREIRYNQHVYLLMKRIA